MTLTQTAILTRQIIVFTVIGLVLLIGGLIGYNVWHAYYLANLPPVEEKPDLKFGTLPPIDFPKVSVSSSNFSYSLDTVTGGLPRIGQDEGFEKLIKVYFITRSFATLLSPDRSTNLARQFDITEQPQILSETQYQFSQNDKTLFVDLDNGNFSYTNESSPSAKESLSDNTSLVSGFKSILATLGMIKDDLAAGRDKVVLFKIFQNALIPTQIRSEAQAAQISLWPNSVDGKPVLTARSDESLVTAVVLGSSSQIDNYLSLDFTYHPIDASTFATYPLKDTALAFEDLKSGKGVVIIEPEKPQVSISSVSLGYYLPQNYSPYLQPIFIFEGPQFMAYVSAVPDQYQGQSKLE
ncbi:hypothetical protein HYS95_00765 [Candidatus Daviesbacteria bacterium]|nr:hypothetical protein [Candidatus Daviesbacteria bacterium]